jgi:hypothetical protein
MRRGATAAPRNCSWLGACLSVLCASLWTVLYPDMLWRSVDGGFWHLACAARARLTQMAQWPVTQMTQWFLRASLFGTLKAGAGGCDWPCVWTMLLSGLHSGDMFLLWPGLCCLYDDLCVLLWPGLCGSSIKVRSGLCICLCLFLWYIYGPLHVVSRSLERTLPQQITATGSSRLISHPHQNELQLWKCPRNQVWPCSTTVLWRKPDKL